MLPIPGGFAACGCPDSDFRTQHRQKGNIFAAVLEGPKKGVFTIVRHDTFDITAGAFLSNGALLLPERIFNRAEGVKKPFR